MVSGEARDQDEVFGSIFQCPWAGGGLDVPDFSVAVPQLPGTRSRL